MSKIGVVQRWAIRDAGIAHFYEISTGRLYASLPTLKTSGINFTGETVYARGGLGNPKLVGFSGNKEGSLSLQDAIFDNDALAMLTGNEAESGSKSVDIVDIVDISNGGVGKLKHTPLGEELRVYVTVNGVRGTELSGEGTGDNTYKVTEKTKITIGSGTVPEGQDGKMYITAVYKAKTSANATSLKVTSDKFGETFRVVLDCQVVDEVSKGTYQAQIRIPNAKFEEEWGLDLSADGDPAVLDLALEILKPAGSTDMYEMVIYDDEDMSK